MHYIAEVAWIELRVLVDIAGEETGTEWAKRRKLDAKPSQDRQKFALRTTPEQRILALRRSDRLDRVRTANRLTPASDKAKVFDCSPTSCASETEDDVFPSR